MKEQIKAPEKIQLSDEEIANLSYAKVQNTGNQDAQRNGWAWLQNRGKSEGYEKWIEGKCTGTNSKGKETGTQTNGLEHRGEISIQTEQNEEIRIQKYEERLRNLRDNLKRSNIWIIGVPEGEEEEQEIKNLFEKNNESKHPWFGKGNKHTSPGSINKMDPSRTTPRHIIIKMPKVKDKERKQQEKSRE